MKHGTRSTIGKGQPVAAEYVPDRDWVSLAIMPKNILVGN
jgi:hypothetical protein